MAPENANIFLVEDEPTSLKYCKLDLEMDGHRVIETADSLREALTKIPTLRDKGINVAIVDGNLSESSYGGNDGELIAKAIKRIYPEIKIVGHAGYEPISNADTNSTKLDGIEKLLEVVKNI